MNKKILIIELILIGALLFFGSSSYAAIEIVPSRNGKGTDAITRTTISNAYLLCQNMKNSGESLEGTTVAPHLTTNEDWGAVSYLSNSVYGTNTTGQYTGVKIQIDGVNYYSTNGNATGVMNWGSNPNVTRHTYASGIIKQYTPESVNETVQNNVYEIYNNKDTRYVDIIDIYNTPGMAIGETTNIYTGFYHKELRVTSPITLRRGLFGYHIGTNWDGEMSNGGLSTNINFRPVIWYN